MTTRHLPCLGSLEKKQRLFERCGQTFSKSLRGKRRRNVVRTLIMLLLCQSVLTAAEVFCILPSLGSETTRRIAITGSTTFEDIVQAAYHSSECSTTTREPRLTWKLSSDNKKTPPASLGNPMQWGRALQRAHEKLSRQRKASDVEIVVGFATPQVRLLLFSYLPLTSTFTSMDARILKTVVNILCDSFGGKDIGRNVCCASPDAPYLLYYILPSTVILFIQFLVP